MLSIWSGLVQNFVEWEWVKKAKKDVNNVSCGRDITGILLKAA